MEKDYQNKAMQPEEARVKVEPKKEEFFFAGGQEYLPQTVKAANLEEATKVYEKTKVKINK